MLRRITCITAVLAAAVLVAGCAESGFNYVKSSEDKTYFKVPKRWTLFDERAVMDGIGSGLTRSERQTELDQTWRIAFDAAPKPSLGHLGSAGAGHPSGLAVVRNLTFDASDSLSNNVLRNYFFDIDAALEDGTGELVSYEELQLDGGFRGLRLVANLDVDGKRMTLDQTALVDQATSKIYALLVSCSRACFDENRGQITKVVDSWTVRDK
ncbi:MAG: hypothetical protein ACKOA9_12145 [Actinomycetota bacterium]